MTLSEGRHRCALGPSDNGAAAEGVSIGIRSCPLIGAQKGPLW